MVTQFTDIVTETVINWIAPRFIEQRDELARLVNLDQLTNLPNRRAFDLALPKARRDGFAFILFDANNFGLVNKKFGHAAGDEILKYYADVLANVAAHYRCRAFRLGGDEFVIIAPHRFALQVRDAAERRALPRSFENFTVSISGEVGYSIEDADSRLQERKKAKKTL